MCAMGLGEHPKMFGTHSFQLRRLAHSNFTQLGFGKYSVAKSIRKIGRGSVHCATGAPKNFFVYLCECISNAQSLLTFVAVLITCKPRSTQTLSNSADKSSSVSIARSPESSASSISANTLRTAVSVECIALYATEDLEAGRCPWGISQAAS